MSPASTPQGETVLVTGGTGLIGANVARSLLAVGCRPVLFDAQPSAENIAGLEGQVVVERGDVRELGDLLGAVTRHRVDSIIHLAAVLTIRAALAPAAGIAINCIGTAHVFQLARQLKLRRVVYASSAAVYGRRGMYEAMLGRHLVTEDDPPCPFDAYGHTKYLCEGYAAQAIGQGQDIVGLRPVMTFGLGRLDGAIGILNQAMRDAALTGRGLVTRPWIPHASINPMYVKDCADLFVRACLHPQRFARPVYNLGTGEYLSLRAMMDLATRSLPAGASIDFEDQLPAESGGTEIPSFDYADLDSSAIRSELAWTPRYGFEGGARECVQHYLDHGQA